jgi:anti-sigma factor RsiW
MNSERLRQKWISRWLDNELSPEEHASFEQELKQDPELAAELKTNIRIHALLQKLPEVAAPDGFQARMRSARAQEVMNNRTGTPFRRWRLALTVAGATFFIGMLFQTTGIQQSFKPVAESELSAADQYAIVASDSVYMLHDSSTTMPEFQFTPVSAH